MKTTEHDERDLIESLYRYGPPALAWAALLAFFAFAGTLSRDEPTRVTSEAPRVRVMAHETAGVPAMASSATDPRERALRDAAIVAHEALDPAGVGLNPTP